MNQNITDKINNVIGLAVGVVIMALIIPDVLLAIILKKDPLYFRYAWIANLPNEPPEFTTHKPSFK